MPNSIRMNWPFPSENSAPWYDAFEDMVTALDAAGYASREDRNLVMVGGGSLSWTLGTSTLVWTADIQILSTVTGHILTAAATTLTLDDGEIVYVNLVRSPTDSSSRTPQVASQIPGSDNAFLLAMRVGSNVYFRNGQRLADGETLLGLGTGPITAGGGLNTQGVGEWKFDTDITDSDPGSGKWKLDDADETAAAFIYMNDANNGGLDASKLIQLLALNSLVYIQRTEDSSEALLYEVTGDPTDGGGYWKIPVTYESEDTAGWSGASNKKYAFLFGTTGGSGGGGGGGLGQWDYATGGGAPAATKITANFDLMSSTTIINIADGSGTDNNFSAAFGAVRAGDYLVIKDSAGGAAYGTFLVAAAPADNTTYWTFTVSTGNVSGSFTDTNTYDFNIISDGSVVGPASSTNNGFARFNGTTGKLLQNTSSLTFASGHLTNTSATAAAVMQERATGPGFDAGLGKFWTKTAVPSEPWFTADDGTESQLNVPSDSGDGSNLGTWTYAGGLSGNAAQNTFRTTGSTGSTITAIQIDWLSNHNNNIQAMLERVAPGDVIYLRKITDSSDYATLQVDSVDAQPDASDWQFQVTRIKATSATLAGAYSLSIEWGAAGDVVGPASATSNGIAVWSGTTGKLLSSPSTITWGSGHLNLSHGTTAALRIDERSSAPTSSAGRGYWWTKADAPTTPHFTDDDDVDHNLNRPTPTTLASNALIDVDATEVVIGGAYLDGSSEGVYSWEILGTYNDNGGGGNQDLIVTLYDRGPDGTPVAGVLRSTISITALDTLDRVSQVLTVASSPGTDTDEIDSDEPRLYEIRAKLDASGGVDTAKILNVKFVES